MKEYLIVINRPVAKFFYKGHHTHPVNRTILVHKETETTITGYELREGDILRKFRNAPIKTFSKDKIAKYGDYCRLRSSKKNAKKSCDQTTLERYDLLDLIKNGV
jgi:hypothetical protein